MCGVVWCGAEECMYYASSSRESSDERRGESVTGSSHGGKDRVS